MSTQPVGPPAAFPIRFAEFVTLIAGMIALSALSIDVMLPALPAMADSFSISDPNERQFVVTVYLLGFAAGQPIYGPLSDRFGRRPVVAVGLCIYALGSLGAVLAPSFSALLLSRAAQGIGAGDGTGPGSMPRFLSAAR